MVAHTATAAPQIELDDAAEPTNKIERLKSEDLQNRAAQFFERKQAEKAEKLRQRMLKALRLHNKAAQQKLQKVVGHTLAEGLSRCVVQARYWWCFCCFVKCCIVYPWLLSDIELTHALSVLLPASALDRPARLPIPFSPYRCAASNPVVVFAFLWLRFALVCSEWAFVLAGLQPATSWSNRSSSWGDVCAMIPL